MKLTFQTGKGNHHLVPVIILLDTVPVLQRLADPSTRDQCSIKPQNKYLFPSTKQSMVHVSGWYAVHRICLNAKVQKPERLTATAMRHRVSTLFAGLDVPENDRQAFYDHMGHDEQINKNTYQTPLAEREILVVGTQLLKMDGQVPTRADHIETQEITLTKNKLQTKKRGADEEAVSQPKRKKKRIRKPNIESEEDEPLVSTSDYEAEETEEDKEDEEDEEDEEKDEKQQKKGKI